MISQYDLSFLNKILNLFPTEENFRIPTIIRDKYHDYKNDFILFDHDTTDSQYETPELKRMSEQLTAFLLEKGFVIAVPETVNILARSYPGKLIKFTNQGIALCSAGSYENYTKHIIQEKDQLIRMDWVLNFMAIHSAQGIPIENAWEKMKGLHPTLHLEYNESYRQQMFDKLMHEGYLKYLEAGIYSITLNGLIFNQEGGYVAKRQNDIKNQEGQKHQSQVLAGYQRWVVIGTLVAGSFYFKELFVWLYTLTNTK